MRRTIFILLSIAACSSANSTGGAQGRADFSFSGVTMLAANKPVALDSDATLLVRIHDATIATKAVFDSQLPDVVAITGVSSGTKVGDWFVVFHAAKEGTSRISVSDRGMILDTLDVTVSAIAKLDIPTSVDVNVARNAKIDVVARNAKGDEVYAPNAIEWTVDRPEVVQFWNSLRNTAQPSTAGTSLDIRGLGVGTATIHGVYRKTTLSVPVNVK